VTSQPCLADFAVEAWHEFAVVASDGLWNVFSDQVRHRAHLHCTVVRCDVLCCATLCLG
jgi:serine/threonine protein phosphatase PrpC